MSKSVSCGENIDLARASTWEAHRRILARINRFPRPTALRMGPIIRLNDSKAGWVNVELPVHRSAVFGSLAVHPRLMEVHPDFCDDTLDGEVFFCSAHNAGWCNTKRFDPYVITHVASGFNIGLHFDDKIKACKVAETLANDPEINWADIDERATEATESLRALRAKLQAMGLRA